MSCPQAIAGHKSRCSNTQQSISVRYISKEKKDSTVKVCANVHLYQALCTGKLKAAAMVQKWLTEKHASGGCAHHQGMLFTSLPAWD